MFWVYMLRCRDRSFYIGHTDNLEHRLAQHQQGVFRTCYTFERRPVVLVYCQPFETREEALAMERRIKRWNRAKKVALTEGNWREVSRIARFKYERGR